MSERARSKFLSTKQAAAFLELSEDHLYRLRRQPGKGPPYRRHGRLIRYAVRDLELWDAEQVRA